MSNATLTTLFPLLSLVAMLWVLWSDSIRQGRTPAAFYILRALIFLALSGVMLFNMFNYSRAYSTGSKALVILSAITGVAGAGYFLGKAKLAGDRKNS
ncbi:MAG: hypothetical protein ABI718_11200 [Acidobacteriota bacterium]